jgi:acetolactate synthase regulatory subunit
MSAGPWRVKPSEIERALKSVKSAGLRVKSVEVCPDGTIKLIVVDVTCESDPEETPEQLRKLL